MKRGRFDSAMSPSKMRLLQILMAVLFFYMLFMSFEIPLILRAGINSASGDEAYGFISDAALPRPLALEDSGEKDAPTRPANDPRRVATELAKVSSLSYNHSDNSSELHRAAKHAWAVGKKLWSDLASVEEEGSEKSSAENQTEKCPNSIALSGEEFSGRKKVLVLPCGLTLWSHITVVGTPRWAHEEQEPKIAVVREGEEAVMVSQFMMELQGLKTVEGEDPPRILHFNPRLKGDWSGKPVLELNTCYRMQWGTPLRCEGWQSRADDDAVDGQVKCEKWIRDDDAGSEESKALWWLNRLIGRTKKVSVDWPYPFAEGRLFVLTVSARLEGYHISVDGQHLTSFPYRTGFVLEDATGLFVNGDVDVHSVFAASLPASHPSFAPQMHLERSPKWKAPALPNARVELFIGILSAGNHFAERMAVRKSWMQHKLIKFSHVVARFFVALHGRKEVNVELKKEAEYFGDIVIVPYMDNYDLVVLKTIAICEYGLRTVAAKYIMKCDDDTFVRVDAVLKEAHKFNRDTSLYIGNMNYHHKPLRYGKWAVTYEEWPEEDYPPYANGPGYIISSDIAGFIVSEYEEHKLRLFKMEDVSMGMWVEKFNGTRWVEYEHSPKYCQFGCIEDYITAHYQSPRQMTCMWDKLQLHGKPQCCNMR